MQVMLYFWGFFAVSTCEFEKLVQILAESEILGITFRLFEKHLDFGIPWTFTQSTTVAHLHSSNSVQKSPVKTSANFKRCPWCTYVGTQYTIVYNWPSYKQHFCYNSLAAPMLRIVPCSWCLCNLIKKCVYSISNVVGAFHSDIGWKFPTAWGSETDFFSSKWRKERIYFSRREQCVLHLLKHDSFNLSGIQFIGNFF
jgi:hypothetical protein